MYPIKNKSQAFNLSWTGTEPFLLMFGGKDNIGHDITLRKSDYTKERSYCHQEGCYEYNGIEHALIGEKEFDMKRLIVIQMA